MTIGGRTIPIELPSLGDARLHTAAVVITIHVLGQVSLDFAVSVPQILAAMLAAALVEVVIVLRRRGVLAWPASAMLTGSGVGLILRVDGTVPGEHWSFHRWWWFSLVAVLALSTKYLIRWRGGHVFNPSNVGLVVSFLVLGSERAEPLPFRWGDPGPGLVLAYVVIFVGGVLITRRLGLLPMAVAFFLVFAFGLGVLARSGHCLVVPWQTVPTCDGAFWQAVALSPEVLVFLFLMIPDPRTVPTARGTRVAFAITVAVVATVMIAPQRTEFGAKVALLGALTIACATRPVAATVRTRLAPTAQAWSAGITHDVRGVVAGLAIVMATMVFVAATVVAGANARDISPAVVTEALPPLPDVEWTPPSTLPDVTLDQDALAIDPSMADGAARRAVLVAVLRGLEVEAMLMRTGDLEGLAAVDHGARLAELQAVLVGTSGAPVAWPSYLVERANMTASRAARQGTAVLALELTGTRIDQLGASPWSAVIAVRRASDARWMIVEVTET